MVEPEVGTACVVRQAREVELIGRVDTTTTTTTLDVAYRAHRTQLARARLRGGLGKLCLIELNWKNVIKFKM